MTLETYTPSAFPKHCSMARGVRVSQGSVNSFRPDIEGLRALAILLVIACHCDAAWCRGGFVGVDVFFVLSGYLITGLLSAELRSSSRLDLLAFYARRVRRLLPACAVVLLATMVAAPELLPPQQLESAARAARAAALYVSNVFFDAAAADYFAPSVESNPFLHTWSLGVEEQFYLVWPLLVMVAAGRRRRALWVLGTVTALSLTCCVYATRNAPTFAFYELPARAWEFAAGGLLTLLPCPAGTRAAHAARAGGVVGVALILAVSALLRSGAGFPGWIAGVPVCGTLAILFAGAVSPQHGISRLLSTAPLQFLGARSYSWYLWHWPCVLFAEALAPAAGSAGKVAAAAVGLCFASLAFRYVECPVRRSSYLRAHAGTALRLAAGALGLTLGAAWLLVVDSQRQTEDVAMQSVHLAESTPAGISLRDCVGEGASTVVQTCFFGASPAAKTLVLFGDSHALQWFGAFRAVAAQQGWRLVTVLKIACPASYINPHHLEPGTDLCDEWRTRAIDAIISLRPTVVVVSSYTGATLRGFAGEEPISTEELRAGTRRTLEALRRATATIVLLRDSPLPPFPVPPCVARRVLHILNAPSTCDFAASARNDAAFAAQRAAAAGLHGVYLLDLSDLLCPETICPAVVHGMIVYRDDNHLATSFTDTLAADMHRRLFGLLGAER
jgi:peptidoglycan/LPS O-acetylase OafA/YrhL